MKKILFVGAEAMPFGATGGLGDVMGSLPAAISKTGEADVRMIMPLYSQIKPEWREKMKEEAVFYVTLSWRRQYCGIYSLKKDGVTYYFVDNEYYFKRDTLYGCFDDGERFAFFSMAALEALDKLDFFPDVLHAHDWQAALSIIYLNHIYKWREEYQKIKTVFTIHNIEYQGKYDFAILGDVFDLNDSEHSLMEQDGCINLMKGAIEDADRVTTVSSKYAEEIQTPEFAHGLHTVLQRNAHKLSGILNGIDYNYYDPKKDPVIAENYSSVDTSGKKACKEALQKECALPLKPDTPLLAIVTRLASHKGLDIIEGAIYDIVSKNDVQLVVLGKGETRYEEYFKYLEACFPDKVRALITYDRDLSKRIYAGADIFLMPSKSEPCGLSQMIASRYGAIPVVRETGGLYDSIKPFWMDGKKMNGNGFTFSGYTSHELKERCEAAIELYNSELAPKLIYKIMRCDFSWKKSAEKYLELYDSLDM